tara:strand:+ start:8985 stop:9350 length:366 start_codon:yes stop_codon:yes gene_type:complete
MDLGFKIISWLLTIMFFISAALQYNDPDPLIWIIIWCTAAALSISFVLNKTSHILFFIAGAIYVIGFMAVFPQKFEGFEIGKGDIKNIEEAREAFGLLIIAISMIIFGLRVRYKKHSKEKV